MSANGVQCPPTVFIFTGPLTAHFPSSRVKIDSETDDASQETSKIALKKIVIIRYYMTAPKNWRNVHSLTK
jgi:hypothetical protein